MKFMKSTSGFILDCILIFLGCFISSLGVHMFLANAQLISGGATGVGLIIQYLTRINSGITVFIINIPLFILSYFKLPKKFTLYTGIGMISLSACLIITSPLSSLVSLNDTLLYCIYGGILCGLGYGIVFSRNGSTGGTDIVNMLIRKKYSNFNIGSLGFAINLIIVAVASTFFGIPMALYTLISMFIQGMVLDKVIKGTNNKQLLFIITEKEQLVISYIINDLHRGVTSLLAEGEYTHDKKKMLYCLVTPRQMIELKNTIHLIDPKAFITVMYVSEVRGKGFRNSI